MLKNILKVNRLDFIELTTETKTVTAKWENDDYNLDDGDELLITKATNKKNLKLHFKI